MIPTINFYYLINSCITKYYLFTFSEGENKMDNSDKENIDDIDYSYSTSEIYEALAEYLIDPKNENRDTSFDYNMTAGGIDIRVTLSEN